MSKHLQNDLEKLKRHILAIGALVEESVENATQAFCARDVELAKKVIEDDELVDQWEVNVEEECLKLLALQDEMWSFYVFILAFEGKVFWLDLV